MENNEKTLSQVTTALVKQGYDSNVKLIDNSTIKMGNQSVNKNDIFINKVYRFEGMSNPSDNSICYAIESNSGLKGILINAYGVDASEQLNAFLKDIEIKEH